jgi:hypothetical protein
VTTWDDNLEIDRTLANGIDACLEALETGQAQIAADMLRVMKIHVSANNQKVKEKRASAPYVRALGKVRARARDEGTRHQHGQSFVEGLLCAANILEKQYRKEG